jgi:hypothetical protein
MSILNEFCHKCHIVSSNSIAVEVSPEMVGATFEECPSCNIEVIIELERIAGELLKLEDNIHICGNGHKVYIMLDKLFDCSECTIEYYKHDIEMRYVDCIAAIEIDRPIAKCSVHF